MAGSVQSCTNRLHNIVCIATLDAPLPNHTIPFISQVKAKKKKKDRAQHNRSSSSALAGLPARLRNKRSLAVRDLRLPSVPHAGEPQQVAPVVARGRRRHARGRHCSSQPPVVARGNTIASPPPAIVVAPPAPPSPVPAKSWSRLAIPPSLLVAPAVDSCSICQRRL